MNHDFRLWRKVRRRLAGGSDLGQTAIVAVVAFSVLAMVIGAFIVQTVVQSSPLLQAKAVEIYANRALTAGEGAYVAALNADPSLAQCNTSTSGSGTCSGIDYGQWNSVQQSGDSGADTEYYAYGNPQPTFDPTTNALVTLSVQVVGAAADPTAKNGYLFDQETLTVSPSNGFLQNVFWSNYESYSDTGSYSTCNYNWKLNYNIDNVNGVSCSPVYFGPTDYLFGPVYTNDSVFVSGNGSASSSPTFGTRAVPSAVTTADPNCLFVDDTHGMSGSASGCSAANSDVASYDTANSASGQPVEAPPKDNSKLGIIAEQNGCLYSGPTQITLSTDANGNGQMTVNSPDTPESTVNGSTWDGNNLASNLNQCPNDGTTAVPLPPNGVVYVQNATASQTQAWANPLDDADYNTVTNLSSSPSPPVANRAVTLTANITSDDSQVDPGATVAFSQTTRSGTSVISGCSAKTMSAPVAVTPGTSPASYTTTATCSTTESSTGTGAFSAAYNSGPNTQNSSGSLGQTNTLNSALSYGPDAQVTAGGCSSCYYGQTSTPDAEGDAFVNGSLSGQLTIGTQNDVIVDGNITYADCAGTWTTGQSGSSAASLGLCPYNPGQTNDVLGLIANNYAEVGRPILPSTSTSNNSTILPSCGATPGATCDPSNGTNGITIDATILALTQSFVVNNYSDGGNEGNLTVYGSVQQFARGPVGTFSGNSLASGYQKQYTWDPLLDYVSPPSYLVAGTASWILSSVTPTTGNTANNECPPLLPIYGSTIYITQYCSTAKTGLPNYPSTTAPSPPTIGAVTANATGTATVNWTDPLSNNGSAITNYVVSPTPSCSSCTFTGLTGPGVTSTTVTGLTAGANYTFSVAATNASGTSNPSAPSASLTMPNIPSVATNVAASTNANGSVTVAWTDPADNGSAITGYTVSPTPTCSTCTYTSLSGPSVASTTVTGLTKGASYTFTVKATNGVGPGPVSSPSSSVTAPNVPGIPTIGTASIGNSSATVSWTAPTSNGGSAITGYVVTPYAGTAAQTAQTFVSTATTETVTGLNNATAYTFKVAAINGVGTGAQSGASNSITPATTPGAPTIGTPTTGLASATVKWTAPTSTGGSAITGYEVTPYIGSSAQTPQDFNSTATTEVVTGLSAGTAYTFKVAAINIIGTGALSTSSASITTFGVPGAPTIGTATAGATGTKSATVTFSAPASNGGSAITGYTVTAIDTTNSSRGGQTATGTGSGIKVTGLTANDSYSFTVTATNAVGTGSASAASNRVTAK